MDFFGDTLLHCTISQVKLRIGSVVVLIFVYFAASQDDHIRSLKMPAKIKFDKIDTMCASKRVRISCLCRKGYINSLYTVLR